ncbi:Poly [ADP-ribose] polymerase 1 [Asimina triloba]
MPMWNHADCILKKSNQIKSVEDVEGLDLLRWEDQQKIRKYVEGGSISSTPIAASECAIEVSQNARAGCKRCNEKIAKGNVRVAMKPDGGAKGLAWHHVKCFIEMSPSTQVDKLSGWDSLSTQDKEAVLSLAKRDTSSARNVSKDEAHGNKELQQSTSKGTKRKKAANDNHKTKISKAGGNSNAHKDSNVNNGNESGSNNSSGKDLDHALEEQSKALWAIKDDLKKHVIATELREMLEANGQDSAGSELDLRDHCADGMLFGALGSCPICSSSLRYSGGQYRCHGHLSAWSKCSYTTAEPVRLKEKWKIPEETICNAICVQWFKSQKANKPKRILPPPSSNKSSGNDSAPSSSELSKVDKLEALNVAISGLKKESMEEWKNKIEGMGGTFHAKLKKDTGCLVVCGELDDNDAEVRKAKRMKVPIVREDYLVDCFKKKKKLPFDQFRVESVNKTLRNDVITVKVKGRSAVHEASGLQDSGHILEDGTSIYNTTLNMSDLSTGINRLRLTLLTERRYVLFDKPLREIKMVVWLGEDKGSDCYVFRKWGRVGNDKIGGTKLEEMSASDAIREFKRLFSEKTGNPWEAWEKKQNFEKQPGKFFPLDIDYGVNKQAKKKIFEDSQSKLAPQLIELMKMLFNVETYRAAMMEFEINMSEMPLGKLSKSNIQKGFEALTELQNLLSSDNDPSIKESLIVDASNRFFTVIPSIHPHVIKNEDDLKSKVTMLEALQDIEIASRLVGFDDDNDQSVDDNYKKLQCGINPLPHDSEDYRLVEKYLLRTHAPTHKDWTLELEEVFSLDREGEFDKFKPYRDKLKNRMLLWHDVIEDHFAFVDADVNDINIVHVTVFCQWFMIYPVVERSCSRLTNFVGILSQGLRIAPPEAPATGYMVSLLTPPPPPPPPPPQTHTWMDHHHHHRHTWMDHHHRHTWMDHHHRHTRMNDIHFGKGVYFADLVSKSAQYCYTDKKDPVGLMLLSEVALGEVYELKKASYMERPPEGKHSTKGLGKKIPRESEYVRWRDEVVVPCGEPVNSTVRASELMYNEYIVYNTAQVEEWSNDALSGHSIRKMIERGLVTFYISGHDIKGLIAKMIHILGKVKRIKTYTISRIQDMIPTFSMSSSVVTPGYVEDQIILGGYAGEDAVPAQGKVSSQELPGNLNLTKICCILDDIGSLN